MSEQLIKRIATASFLLAILAGAVFYRPFGLLFLMAVVLALIWYEIWSVARSESRWTKSIMAGVLSLFWVFSGGAVWALMLAAVMAIASSARDGAWVLLALIGVSLGAGGMAWVLVQCFDVALWVIAVVIATDVGGYFVGRALGGPKVWVALSPNKTYAGVFGGWALVLLITAFWHPIADSLLCALALAIGFSIFAQMGDFAQSAFKRHFGVKDSSAILPGHGGVFDRFDGYCGAGVFICILLMSQAITGIGFSCA